MHSVDGDEVVLHSPLLVELQFVVCDLRSIVWRCHSGTALITLTFPPEEQRRMKERLQRRNQDSLHVLYAPQSAHNTLSTNAPVKQASLRSSPRSLIERGVDPLGNLNKVYRAHFAWPAL